MSAKLESIIAQSNYISLCDYTEYRPETCRNGGDYGFETRYYRDGDEWVAKEYTTADFCPYCHSWDCSGECHEEERFSTADVLIHMQEWIEFMVETEDEEVYITCKNTENGLTTRITYDVVEGMIT